jgi:hypothetical protein
MWGDFADSSSGVTSNLGYVEEGNVKKFKFTTQAQRVRFLTEDVDVEQIMSEQKMTREEAVDYINRTIGREKWLAPKSFWEHSVKSIPNQRFFSTIACVGKTGCLCCAENEVAREKGVTENKMLPYPVRKRFICPAYVYDLKMVLYVVGAEDFFSSIAKYIEKNGSDIDFELSKEGKGFDTTYSAFFLGKATEKLPKLEVLAPADLDLFCGEEEARRRMTGGTSKPKSPVHGEEPKSFDDMEKVTTDEKPSEDVEFKMPFGTHKGKTFAEIEQIDGRDYIKFLSENSVGTVQIEAEKYLKK